MRLATLAPVGSHSSQVIVLPDTIEDAATAGTAIALGQVPDVGALIAIPGWRDVVAAAIAEGTQVEWTRADLAPVIPQPGKIICVGLNYGPHIEEMGRALPEVPTLFAKYPEALARPEAVIEVFADNAQALDYEGELAVIIGQEIHRVSQQQAAEAIAGYAVMNDLTMRDRQYVTLQWMQGKTLVGSASFGPWMTTADAFDSGELTTTVNGELRQSANTADLVFSPAALIAHITQFLPLKPGDVIVTGTPGGVGWARGPHSMLADGDEVTVAISGLGAVSSTIAVQAVS